MSGIQTHEVLEEKIDMIDIYTDIDDSDYKCLVYTCIYIIHNSINMQKYINYFFMVQ